MNQRDKIFPLHVRPNRQTGGSALSDSRCASGSGSLESNESSVCYAAQ